MPFCASVITEVHPATGAPYYTLSVTEVTTPPSPTDLAQCQVVIESGAEYNNWQQMLSLSVDDAQVIGTAVLVLWAVAWGFRALRMALNSSPERYDHET